MQRASYTYTTLALLSVALLLSSLATTGAEGIFIPFIKPLGYAEGQILNMRVTSLTSTRTVLPYSFYSVKTCQPPPSRFRDDKKKENLGEVMVGYNDEPSEYFVEMNRNVTCRKVCTTLTYDAKERATLVKRINEFYRGNMALDGLPVAQQTRGGPRAPKVLLGYPLGIPAKFSPTKTALINNHLHFTIYFNEPEVYTDQNDETFRIVGFHVSAHSIDYKDVNVECDASQPMNFKAPFLAATDDLSEITYTYSVSWVPEPNVYWATRWDIYMRGTETDRRFHWVSLVSACSVALCLAGLIGMILVRALRKDLSRYNEVSAAVKGEDVAEDSGWKMVHGDVFRAPERPVWFSLAVASGTQVYLMAAATLTISMSGFLNPQNRGSLVTVVILCFVVVSFFSGYIAAVLLKQFKHQAWKHIFLTATALPGAAMSLYVLLNFVHWAKHASSAVPFTTLLVLFGMWLLCTVPLTIVGAHFGYRREETKMPCRVHVVPRMIPAPRQHMHYLVPALVGAVFPFGVASIEIIYILSSFWQGSVYYIFGFLSAVFVVVTLCSAMSAIGVTYYNLCNEDYRWWWTSLIQGGITGAYVFLYSLYYLAGSLQIRQPSSLILYIGYMFMASTAVGLMFAFVNFAAAFAFVRKIYSVVKID